MSRASLQREHENPVHPEAQAYRDLYQLSQFWIWRSGLSAGLRQELTLASGNLYLSRITNLQAAGLA